MTDSVPLALRKKLEVEKTEKLELEDKEFFEGLKNAGFGDDKGLDSVR